VWHTQHLWREATEERDAHDNPLVKQATKTQAHGWRQQVKELGKIERAGLPTPLLVTELGLLTNKDIPQSGISISSGGGGGGGGGSRAGRRTILI
jgi:hypothetical protein